MTTRHLLAYAIVLMLLAGPAAAMPWRWGVRAGLNGANFAGEFGEILQPHLRYGLNAGLVGEAGLAHALSVHAEIAYSNKGGKAAGLVTDNAGNLVGALDDTWAYDYIEVPVLLRARLEHARGATLFAELGPSFGIAIAGRFTPAAPGLAETDLKDDMKTVDAGFALGAGVAFAAGPGRLGIEARYTRGFSDLYDLSGNAASINQVWTLALSWMR
jgi:outer membrane protein with beta-barrel domain